MKPDARTRHFKAAQAYIRHKGYKTAFPHNVVQVEGDLCWYFYYALPDGNLELEVAWDGQEWQYDTWFTKVERPTLVAAGR